MFAFARINPCELVEFGNLAADVNQQMRRIKAGDTLYARFASEHGAAECFLAYSIRADDAHSGDDDTRKHVVEHSALSNQQSVSKLRINSFAVHPARNSGLAEYRPLRAECDNHTDAARIVHFRALLPHKVHVL